MSENYGPQHPQGGQFGQQPYGQPSAQPYGQPSAQPYGQPSAQPYGQPSAQPYGQPSGPVPLAQPMGQPGPYGAPIGQPVAQPSAPPAAATFGGQLVSPPGAAPYGTAPGQPLYAAQPAYPGLGYAPSPPPKRGGNGMVIGMVAAGLALLSLLGALGYFLTKPKDPTPTPIETTTTTPGPTTPAPSPTAPSSTAPVPTTTTPAPKPTTPKPTLPTTTAPSPAPGGQQQPIDKGVVATVPAGYAVKQVKAGVYVFSKGDNRFTVQVYAAAPNAPATGEMDSYIGQMKPKYVSPQVIPTEAKDLGGKPGTAAYGGISGASASGGSTETLEQHAYILVRSADGAAALVNLTAPAGTVNGNDAVIEDMRQILNSVRSTLFA